MNYILMQIYRTSFVLMSCAVLLSCSMKPQQSETIDAAPGKQVDSLYARAINAASEGDTSSAIKMFENLINEGSNNSNIYTNLGLQYLQNGDIEAADKLFDQSLVLNPGDYVAYNNKAVIKRQQGEFDEAEKLYRLAIKSNPDYSYAHHNIAILYDLYMHDLDKALQHYSQYQALNEGGDKLVAKWIVDLKRRIELVAQ